MTSDNPKSLSKYQRAILTHLGIVPWHLKSNTSSASETQSAPKPDPTINSIKRAKPSQERREAGLEKLKEIVSIDKKVVEQKISIPDQGLVLLENREDSKMFINDVMQVVGLEASKYQVVEPAKEHEYVDFKLLWSISTPALEQNNHMVAKLVGNHLTTAQLDSENAIALKKQLWQILQNHSF